MSTLLLLLLLLIFLILLPVLLIYKPPHLLIRYVQYLHPTVLFHVPTASKILALTIDDGPSNQTSAIASVLAAHNATATFFIIGSHITPSTIPILQTLVRNGNELANHAMYDSPSISLSQSELVSQISHTQSIIDSIYESVTANSKHFSSNSSENSKKLEGPKYFRPASGFFNESMKDTVETMGYRLVLGSVYPHDPQVPWWRMNAWHVLSGVREGSVVICHDGDGRNWTVPMLNRVLPELKRRGWKVVSLTELLKESGKVALRA